MVKVSIVIPNYNGERFLKDCLESLKRQSFEEMEVIMVDNASDDGSIDTARKLYPDIRILELSENTGFAPAVNRGIEAAEGEYVILLNNDKFLTVHFYFSTCIFGVDHLIASAYLHCHFFSIHNTARTYGNNFCFLRLFLSLSR